MRQVLLGRLAGLSERARRARMKRFTETLGVTAETTVLDVGGTPEIWRLSPVHPRVVFLNEPRTLEEQDRGTTLVFADGCRLPFRDGAFDVVFSNSVIEHVGDATRQRTFAAEAARVGRSYWVQTPNRRFPVEVHLHTPLVHWLPRAWQRWLVPRFTIWAWLAQTTPDRREFYLRHYLDTIRLLDAGQLSLLFPGGRILASPKSLVAVRKAGLS